jgi:hypothetical protein
MVSVYSRVPSEDPEAPHVPPAAEAWAFAFDREHGHVATKLTMPLDAASFGPNGLAEVAGCSLSLARARGNIATGARKMSWDLDVRPPRATPVMHLTPRILYDLPFPPFKLVTPLVDTRVSGAVTVTRDNGAPAETWPVDAWPAMVGHGWGIAHPRVYAWAHCNSWEDGVDLAFEAVSARIRMGPVLSPMATAVFVRFRGREWNFNTREVLGINRGAISMRRWEASARGEGLELDAELAAETDDFVGVHYPNPSGAMTYCLSTKLARTRLELRLPGRSPLVVTSRAGSLEIGTHDRDHGVRMYV